MIRRFTIGMPVAILALASCDCAGASDAGSSTPSLPLTNTGLSSGLVATENAAAAAQDPRNQRMWMTVGERRFAITLTASAAASALTAQLPLTLDLSELNGNEKHASLPNALPANASRPGTIRIGDLMLYGTDTLVVFYSTFHSSYSYTPLGRMDDPTGLSEALGRRGVRIVFSMH